MERYEGDRKGPHSTQPNPRLYYDDGGGSPGTFIVEAGADVGEGGDPCGRLRTPKVQERKMYSSGDPRGRHVSQGHSAILEQDLAHRWHALPLMQSLPLISGEACYLRYAGRSGGPQGPDIRDAVLQFAPEHTYAAEGSVTGDIEFHIRCSDWYAHQHHTDPRYNNVILHVVLIFDSNGPVLCQGGHAVPVCSLNDLVPTIFAQPLWPCQCILPSMNDEARAALLQYAGMSRFEQKTQNLLAQLRLSQPHTPFSAYDVCLIPALVEALGYGRDRVFFRAVGQRLVGLPGDIPEPAGRAAQPSPLDATRLQISGNLVEQWRAKGAWETIRKVIINEDDLSVNEGRPQGSPPHPTATPAPTMTSDEQDTHRSHCKGGGGAEMGGDPCGRPRPSTAGLISDSGPYASTDGLIYAGGPRDGLGFDSRPRPSTAQLTDKQITNTIKDLRALFPDPGPARADILICNVVLPFAAAIAYLEQDQLLLEQAQDLYRAYPGLASNQVTRSMYRQLGLEREPKNACQQQGLHHIYAQTCREKQCATCIVVRRDT